MKYTLLILTTLFVFLFTSNNTFSQRKVKYTYDKSGNRLSRVISGDNNLKEELDTEKEELDTEKEINEEDSEIIIKSYPNPITDYITIQFEDYEVSENDHIEIVDLQGALKQVIKPLQATNTIDLKNYTKGIYLMLIHTKGNITEQKIIKQ